MILVTLGTNDKPFTRLLKAVEKAIDDGVVQEKVVVQAGFTTYASDKMEIIDYFDRNRFEQEISKASMIVTHGGAGTIMSALEKRKVILGVPRLKQYGEHVNDHQIQLLQSFEEEGYLIYVKELDKLATYIQQAGTFTPKVYRSEKEGMVKLIGDWIDTH